MGNKEMIQGNKEPIKKDYQKDYRTVPLKMTVDMANHLKEYANKQFRSQQSVLRQLIHENIIKKKKTKPEDPAKS